MQHSHIVITRYVWILTNKLRGKSVIGYCDVLAIRVN